jgi:hypothetical protein
MNPWLAMLLGFVAGFGAGTVLFICLSMFMGYTTAILNEDAIDKEVERRSNDNE